VFSGKPNRIRIGGVALIAATLLFTGVFSYLAAAFDYPRVLDRPAADVLPALLALGTTGRLVWLLYGVIPLLLIPTGRGVMELARNTAPALGRLAARLAQFSAVAMMIGLLRWPTLHWTLAQQWASATTEAREPVAQRFAVANLYLGNVIGEFAGELLLNGFFLAAAIVIARQPRRRWILYVASAASVLGWIAMLRNLTPLVAPIAAANNGVLPIWMLVLGLTLAAMRPVR